MNYKKLKDWNSGFVERIIKRHPLTPTQQNGFTGGTVTGERGSGKSMYAYKVMAKVYYDLNGYSKTDDEEAAYDEALKYIIFKPADFINLIIHNKKNHVITPVISLDDASVHFGKYLFQTNPKLNSAVQGLTATLRTAVTGFIATTPTRKHLAKFLREYNDFKIRIIMRDDAWRRFARCYRWIEYPDEKKYRVVVPYQDIYSCFVPKEFYEPYYEKKMNAELDHAMKSIEFCKDQISA